MLLEKQEQEGAGRGQGMSCLVQARRLLPGCLQSGRDLNHNLAAGFVPEADQKHLVLDLDAGYAPFQLSWLMHRKQQNKVGGNDKSPACCHSKPYGCPNPVVW